MSIAEESVWDSVRAEVKNQTTAKIQPSEAQYQLFCIFNRFSNWSDKGQIVIDRKRLRFLGNQLCLNLPMCIPNHEVHVDLQSFLEFVSTYFSQSTELALIKFYKEVVLDYTKDARVVIQTSKLRPKQNVRACLSTHFLAVYRDDTSDPNTTFASGPEERYRNIVLNHSQVLTIALSAISEELCLLLKQNIFR